MGVAQTLKTQAIFYDDKDKPYRVERKYEDLRDTSVIYTMLTHQSAYSLKIKKFKRGDTLIVTEQYGYIKRDKTKLEQLSEAESFGLASNEKGDSFTVSFLEYVYHHVDSIPVFKDIGDTVFTGPNAYQKAAYFADNIKSEVITHIANDQISIQPVSLGINETVISYYINNHLVKAEWIDGANDLFRITSFKYTPKSLHIKHVAVSPNKTETLSTQKVVWNNDTSMVNWTRSRPKVLQKNRLEYIIANSSLKTFEKNKLIGEINYTEPVLPKDIFNYLILDYTIYNDPYINIELYDMSQEPLFSIKKNNDTTSYSFEYDDSKRMTKLERKWNNNITKTIRFEYK